MIIFMSSFSVQQAHNFIIFYSREFRNLYSICITIIATHIEIDVQVKRSAAVVYILCKCQL